MCDLECHCNRKLKNHVVKIVKSKFYFVSFFLYSHFLEIYLLSTQIYPVLLLLSLAMFSDKETNWEALWIEAWMASLWFGRRLDSYSAAGNSCWGLSSSVDSYSSAKSKLLLLKFLNLLYLQLHDMWSLIYWAYEPLFWLI